MKNISNDCKQCNSSWLSPSAQELKFWQKLDECRKEFAPELEMINYICSLGYDEYTAKTIVGHVTRSNHCVSCGGNLPAFGILECSDCGAINYNLKKTNTDTT